VEQSISLNYDTVVEKLHTCRRSRKQREAASSERDEKAALEARVMLLESELRRIKVKVPLRVSLKVSLRVSLLKVSLRASSLKVPPKVPLRVSLSPKVSLRVSGDPRAQHQSQTR